ncbi:MAG: hypothetical protein ABSF51_13460 [Verrucomicrobiota bacterium]
MPLSLCVINSPPYIQQTILSPANSPQLIPSCQEICFDVTMILIGSKLHAMNRNQNAILRKKAANLHSQGGQRRDRFCGVPAVLFGAFYSQNGVSAKSRQWYISQLES